MANLSVPEVLVTALVTAAVIGLLSRVLRKAKPVEVSDTAGVIQPEKSTAWLTIIAGCAMALGGLYQTLFGGMGPRGWLVTLAGLCIAGFMAPSLTSVHRVTWGEEAIEGPSNLFGPTLGLRRTMIRWGDIARAGTTFTGYWYVESGDGRRVYWSYLYKGHGVLAAYLRAKRPDLTLPVRS